MPPLPSGEYTVAKRDHFDSGTMKSVSIILSGLRMRSRRNTLNGCPDATSTTRAEHVGREAVVERRTRLADISGSAASLLMFSSSVIVVDVRPSVTPFFR